AHATARECVGQTFLSGRLNTSKTSSTATPRHCDTFGNGLSSAKDLVVEARRSVATVSDCRKRTLPPEAGSSPAESYLTAKEGLYGQRLRRPSAAGTGFNIIYL